MKKTIQINLAGTVFHIDDDAYDLLRNYLNSVERKFSRDPGGSAGRHSRAAGCPV